MNLDEAQSRAAGRLPQLGRSAYSQLVTMAVYALVPLHAAPPAWRRRRHPEKGEVVPCYLSAASARLAADNLAQIVRVAGRDFFTSLDTTSVWIDPDGVSLLLTTDQVQALLAEVPAPQAIGEDRTLAGWSTAHDLPPAVQAAWLGILTRSPGVRAAYWLEASTSEPPPRRRLVLLTHVNDDGARLLDAMVAALRATYAGPLRIEAQALVDGELPEAHERLPHCDPFFRGKPPRMNSHDTSGGTA